MTTDAFSAGDSDDTTSGTTLSDSTSEEYKYAQVSVPNFSFDTTSSSTSSSSSTNGSTSTETDVTTTTTSSTASTNPSGNSFLRLGSFPYSTTTATTTTDDTGIATSTTVSYPDAPTGFEDSLTLAKLVGDATALAAYTTDDSSTVDGDGVISSDPYKGDSNGLLGFADDSRVRDDADLDILYIDKTNKTNSTANRRAETQRLLTKGGWWDHSDGNRISTTAGDKIEIIQGNYKLVVLGRRDPSKVTDEDAGDLEITDISGGYTFSKTYEYLEDEKIWATYESSSAKRAYSKTAGVAVSEFVGSKRVTIIGEDPGEGGGIKNPGDNDPTIISKTWAQRMETYTGSANKPVNYVETQTFVDSKVDYDVGLSRVLIKSYAGSNVAITGVGGASLTVSAALTDTTVKTGLLALSLTAILQTYELKFGWVASVNKTKSGFFFKEEKAFVAKDEIAALRNEVVAIRNAVVQTHNEVTNVKNQVANNYNVLAASILHVAAFHSYS